MRGELQRRPHGFSYRDLHPPALREEDVVDPAQLDVDLQTEVGEGLRRRLLNVLHLHALRGHAEHRVANALHLSCNAKHPAIKHDPAQRWR